MSYFNLERYKEIAESIGNVGDNTKQYILNERGQKILLTQQNTKLGEQHGYQSRNKA